MDDLIWLRPHSGDGSVMEMSGAPKPKYEGWVAYIRVDTYAAKLEADKAK